jgi:hypothetical protein
MGRVITVILTNFADSREIVAIIIKGHIISYVIDTLLFPRRFFLVIWYEGVCSKNTYTRVAGPAYLPLIYEKSSEFSRL